MNTLKKLFDLAWPFLRGLGLFVFVVAIAMHLAKPDSGPQVDSDAPSFTVPTLGQTPFRLEAHRGQVVLLDFWATWCPSCRKGLPSIQALHERYAGDARVHIATVNSDQGPGRLPGLKAFMQRRSFDFPVLLDGPESQISRRYDVRSIPTTIIIDAAGKVRWVESGLASTDPDRLTAHLDAAIQSALSGS